MATTRKPVNKKSTPANNTKRKTAQGKSIPKIVLDDANDLVLVHLTLANDCMPLTIMGNIEVYDHGEFEFQMYRHEYLKLEETLLETELDLVDECYAKAEKTKTKINDGLKLGKFGHRQASKELQTCNGPKYFYEATDRGIKPIRKLEIVRELGAEATPENLNKKLIRLLTEEK